MSNIISEIEKGQLKSNIPKFNVGDTVRVHFRIVEGNKERIQVFEGVVIARANGESANGNFTVRRVSYNEGVERVFPLHSPRLDKVEVTQEGHVRRAKLHYLRERSGKAARVKQSGFGGQKIDADVESPLEGTPEPIEEPVSEETDVPTETTEAPVEATETAEAPAEETKVVAEETEKEESSE